MLQLPTCACVGLQDHWIIALGKHLFADIKMYVEGIEGEKKGAFEDKIPSMIHM